MCSLAGSVNVDACALRCAMMTSGQEEDYRRICAFIHEAVDKCRENPDSKVVVGQTISWQDKEEPGSEGIYHGWPLSLLIRHAVNKGVSSVAGNLTALFSCSRSHLVGACILRASSFEQNCNSGLSCAQYAKRIVALR